MDWNGMGWGGTEYDKSRVRKGISMVLFGSLFDKGLGSFILPYSLYDGRILDRLSYLASIDTTFLY